MRRKVNGGTEACDKGVREGRKREEGEKEQCKEKNGYKEREGKGGGREV